MRGSTAHYVFPLITFPLSWPRADGNQMPQMCRVTDDDCCLLFYCLCGDQNIGIKSRRVGCRLSMSPIVCPKLQEPNAVDPHLREVAERPHQSIAQTDFASDSVVLRARGPARLSFPLQVRRELSDLRTATTHLHRARPHRFGRGRCKRMPTEMAFQWNSCPKSYHDRQQGFAMSLTRQ